MYLVVSDKRRVVGLAAVVPIERAYRVIQLAGGADSNTMCSSDPEPAKIGISRIWVHRNHRRKGFGSRLLDAVRARTGVATHELAFSQPTFMGASLAQHWFGRGDFLLMKG